ncbi:MAG: PilW family protein [Rhodanobacter sp.]
MTPSRIRLHEQRGLTLIELMVAMVLGLLVAAGIVTVFASTSSSNKAQNQLARLQEEGRFAISRLGTDLRMTNGQYCTNTGGVALASSGGNFLDHLRTPNVFAKHLLGTTAGAVSGALGDVTTAWGATSGTITYPAAPTAAYSMPSFLFMRGYDCTVLACTPVDPHASIATIPAMNSTLGSRVLGTDVLTVRYINPSSGWAIMGLTGVAPTGSTIATSSSVGTITSITLRPLTSAGEPPITNFANGDLAMLADCSNAQIFAVTNAAGVLTPDGPNNFTGSSPAAQQPESGPKVFDVNRDLQTVTYYVKVVSVNNDGNAPFTGALMRRVNGGLLAGGINPAQKSSSEDELVRGVERLDFKYGIEDATGNTSFVSAKDVDTSTNCPPSELNQVSATGCLWRGVKSIEVSLLMDGQVPLYTLGANDMFYAYSQDTNPLLVAPSAHNIKPSVQGFPDQMLRREFNALIAVRNYNP